MIQRKEKMRVIATLYTQGYRPKEIAELTGINYNTVRSYISRLRKRGIIGVPNDLRAFEIRLGKVIRDIEEYVVLYRLGKAEKSPLVFLEETLRELKVAMRYYRAVRRHFEIVSRGRYI